MRFTSLSDVCLVAMTAILLAGGVDLSGQAGPRTPYEDVGACPFEGCVYREWIARRATPVYRERDRSSSILSQLARGDRVQAITGIVITTRPGVVRFTQAWRGFAQPGDLLYFLTFQGEGHIKAWFEGKVIESLDASDFLNGLCGTVPNGCPALVLQQPTRVWWIQVKTPSGQVGWTDRPQDFANKDALGAVFEEESPDAGLDDFQ
jgi:hypothetical protein